MLYGVYTIGTAGGGKSRSTSTRLAGRPCARFSATHTTAGRRQQFFADTSPALSSFRSLPVRFFSDSLAGHRSLHGSRSIDRPTDRHVLRTPTTRTSHQAVTTTSRRHEMQLAARRIRWMCLLCACALADQHVNIANNDTQTGSTSVRSRWCRTDCSSDPLICALLSDSCESMACTMCVHANCSCTIYAHLYILIP